MSKNIESGSRHANKHYGIQNFNLVRRIARELLLNGYRGYREFIDLPGDSDSTYADRVKKVYYALEPCMSWPRRGRNSIWTDELRISENPLYALFKTYHMSGKSQYAIHFVLLDILSDGEWHTLADIHHQITGIQNGTKLEQSDIWIAREIDAFVNKKLIYVTKKGSYKLVEGVRKLIDTYWGDLDEEMEPYLRVLAGRRALNRDELIYALKADARGHRYYGIKYIGQKNQISQRLDEYYCAKKLINKQTGRGYSLSEADLTGLLVEHPLLEDAICFFSEYSPLGVIGSFIMDEYEMRSNRFVFKNQFIWQALDAIVLCDVFDAISRRIAVEITAEQISSYVPESRVIYPICVLSKTMDGRQYVYAYDPDFICSKVCLKDDGEGHKYQYTPNPQAKAGYVCIRLDNVYTAIPMPELAQLDDAIINEGKAILKLAWGISLGTSPFPVNVSFSYDKAFIRKRLWRERRNGDVNETEPGRAEFSVNVGRPMEMIPWLLTYMGYLTNITLGDKPMEIGKSKQSKAFILMLDRMKAHIEDLYRLYHGWPRFRFDRRFMVGHSKNPQPATDAGKQAPESKYTPTLKKRLDYLDSIQNNSELFQPIYSKYIHCIKGILNRLCGPHTSSDVKRIVLEEKKKWHIHYISDEDMDREITSKKLYHGKDKKGWELIQNYNRHMRLSGLVEEEGYAGMYCSCLLNPDGLPRLPLTVIQIRWLLTILADEKAGLFLDDDEIISIREQLEAFNSQMTPLYSASDYLYTDQHCDGDVFKEPNYRANLRVLLWAMRKNVREVRIEYCTHKERAENRSPTTYFIKPIRIEYSKHSDKLQLLGRFTREPPKDATLIQRADTKMFSIRLSNIANVCIDDDSADEQPPNYAEPKSEEPIVVRVLNIYESLERFQMIFSPYNKATRFEGEKVFSCSDGNRYKVDACLVTLYYCKRDENEIMSKLRAFGRAVEILSPARLRKAFIDRVDRQHRLFVEAGFMEPISPPPDKGQALPRHASKP